MKISYILLAIVAVLTLTGMVATDVLLKQQYAKIDWRDPYQSFIHRALPAAKHWVIEGTPTNEILVLRSTGKPRALINPAELKFYRSHQQGDTVFIAFTPDYSRYQNGPRADADHQQNVLLVLQLPDLQTLRITNGRLTISAVVTGSMAVSLQNSRLRTHKLAISKDFTLTASQNSFAVLGADRYKSLQVSIQDSSGVQLNDSQVDVFTRQMSPKGEIQLRGQALTWLK